jgi:RhtB (resistance to homoserine/threonine) family protein
MTLESLAIVLAIHAVALISPGPDFAVVTRMSLVSGRRAGLWAAAGVASSIGIYVLVCAFGLSLVITALPDLSHMLTFVGAAYLAWLGIQCLRSTGALPEATQAAPSAKSFVTGLLTNLLNPKAMLYFSSVLSQVLTPELSTTDTTTIWLLLVCESLLWFGLVALVFSSTRVLAWIKGKLVWLDRAVGVVLMALAAKLAWGATR